MQSVGVGVGVVGDNIELHGNACTERSQNISGWVTIHKESKGVKEKIYI